MKEIGTKFDGKQDYIIYIKAKLGENETVPKILEALLCINTFHPKIILDMILTKIMNTQR